MSKNIHILAENIINQIAAGEVVERPFSVIKELVENSLDAGATQIFTTVKNGGRDYISVWDNGSGMSPDNLKRSILRHATSKIQSADDLNTIRTNGFRGEALAAVSSVSHIEIITAEDEKTGGMLLRADGGKISAFSSAAFPTGTRTTVENLFYNTPARRRFMKSEKTELGHICDWIVQMGINCPRVHFRLTHNQKLIYDFPAVSNPLQRIASCVGNGESEALLEFSHTEHYVALTGFICEPAAARASKRWQYIYVNNRFVKEKTIMHAVYEGYKTLLMKNQHPFFFLHVFIDPAEIDVNVHPSKTEIRLRNASLVHTIVTMAIRNALKEKTRERMLGNRRQNTERPIGNGSSGTNGSPTDLSEHDGIAGNRENSPTVFRDETGGQRSIVGFPNAETADTTLTENTAPPKEPPVDDDSFFGDLPVDVIVVGNTFPGAHKTSGLTHHSPFSETSWVKTDTIAAERTETHTPTTVRLNAIGEFGKFIIAAMYLSKGKKELVIIDKHAAHERIRYEEIRSNYYGGDVSQRQSLLTPLIIRLSPRDSVLIEKDLEHWQKIGIDIENFGRHTYKISALPTIFTDKKINPERMIKEILDELAVFGKSGKNEIYLNCIFEKMACHSSIRGEQSLSLSEMDGLLDKLMKLDINLYCPHGRPVMIKFTDYELEKRFKRIV